MIVNDPAVLAQVTTLVDAYEAALMSNDVEALDGAFWNSPHTVRLGVAENLWSFDEIAACFDADWQHQHFKPHGRLRLVWGPLNARERIAGFIDAGHKLRHHAGPSHCLRGAATTPAAAIVIIGCHARTA